MYKKLKRFHSRFTTHQDLIEKLYLTAIIESYGRVRLINGIQSLTENKIRDKFILDFEKHNSLLKDLIASKTIKFTNENRIVNEADSFRTDIEFFITGYGDFVVECKRLSSAETRYVHGREESGEYKVDGLERFTSLIYAKKDDYAGMIGFIVDGNSSTVFHGLRSKTGAFKFIRGFEALLGSKCVAWDLSFQSKHLRDNNTVIHVYHLFFDFIANA